jgi:hypothetical protein
MCQKQIYTFVSPNEGAKEGRAREHVPLRRGLRRLAWSCPCCFSPAAPRRCWDPFRRQSRRDDKLAWESPPLPPLPSDSAMRSRELGGNGPYKIHGLGRTSLGALPFKGNGELNTARAHTNLLPPPSFTHKSVIFLT